MDPALPVVHELDLNGLPALWVEGPPPTLASLVFRVGRADETMPLGGITHLVEHLALWRVGRRPFDYNGFVEATRTVMFARADHADVAAFLGDVSTALTSLPLERAEPEGRVLAAEAATRNRGVVDLMRLLRFGNHGSGLLGEQEYGLRWVGPEEVRVWCSAHFTRDNAIAWFLGPDPSGIEVSLPAGERRPLPANVPLDVRYPCWFAGPPGGVAVSLLGPREAGFQALIQVAEGRLWRRLRHERAISYTVQGFYEGLTADQAHGGVVADATEEVATVRDAFVTVLDEVATDGPDETEVADYRDRALASVADPQGRAGWLDWMATARLGGRPDADLSEVWAQLSGVTPAKVREAASAALGTALLVVPEGTDGPADGYARYPEWSTTVVTGPAYDRPRSGDRLIVGPDGVTLRIDGNFATVRYASLEMVEDDGETISLYGRDGIVVRLDPGGWYGPEPVSEVRRAIPPSKVVPGWARGPLHAGPPFARRGVSRAPT